MILDSSALVAIVMGEPGWEDLLRRIRTSRTVGVAAPTIVETGMVLSRLRGTDAIPLLMELIEELDIEVIPFSKAHSRAALNAFLRFGKGRHPAALNFGDCMAYAAAAVAEKPLLYVGGDFARTDLGTA